MEKILKIAVCDDSFFDREINKMYIEDYVEKKGFEAQISSFSSGGELLQADLTDFALIFLDIYMDGINGVETAEQILKTNKDVKIVFCSSSPEFISDAYEMDAFRYFSSR